MEGQSQAARAAIIGADVEVPCVDGRTRRYVNLDYAASTPAMAGVLAAVQDFLPWYTSVHRGAGYKSQLATAAYEAARRAVLDFAGRDHDRDRAIILPQHHRGDQPPRPPPSGCGAATSS